VSTTATAPVVSASTTSSTAAIPAVIGDFPVATVLVGDTVLVVWVADTPDKRQQGLMRVESLPHPVQGMLFVFESPLEASFWMLNTLMPLDIWWFSEDRTLIGMDTMEPCEERPCPSYLSPGPVLWALETPAGAFDFDVGSELNWLARHDG
jgi:uncharacterized membrane protein (UPF0127 family)